MRATARSKPILSGGGLCDRSGGGQSDRGRGGQSDRIRGGQSDRIRGGTDQAKAPHQVMSERPGLIGPLWPIGEFKCIGCKSWFGSTASVPEPAR